MTNTREASEEVEKILMLGEWGVRLRSGRKRRKKYREKRQKGLALFFFLSSGVG
jgi:hypothetical protein